MVVGGGLSATVVPERGGRISSLVDNSGREWLAQPEKPDGPLFGPGSTFIDADMAGWDECAPTIDACEVDGVQLPDHGELWTTRFDAKPPTVSGTGALFGYGFERTIVPTADGLRLEYSAWTLGGDVPFLWAAHPQFVAPVGSRLIVSGVDTVFDVISDPIARRDWSDELSRIDTLADHACRKLYLAPDDPRFEATLVHPDERSLTMRWSEECPYLGLWFDRRRFSREPVIAIEPSTGYFDSLEAAVANRRVALLKPDEPLRWWVELTVSR